MAEESPYCSEWTACFGTETTMFCGKQFRRSIIKLKHSHIQLRNSKVEPGSSQCPVKFAQQQSLDWL